MLDYVCTAQTSSDCHKELHLAAVFDRPGDAFAAAAALGWLPATCPACQRSQARVRAVQAQEDR
jgi:hypothetical protein